MGEREPSHYRIEVDGTVVGTGLCFRARALPLGGTGLSVATALMPREMLRSANGVAAFAQWAENLPWRPDETHRSGSYHESLFAERTKDGYPPGFRVDAFNDFTEEFTDSDTIWDDDLEDPEAWRRLLQWAETLGRLS